jgi:hypothetical protein
MERLTSAKPTEKTPQRTEAFGKLQRQTARRDRNSADCWERPTRTTTPGDGVL